MSRHLCTVICSGGLAWAPRPGAALAPIGGSICRMVVPSTSNFLARERLGGTGAKAISLARGRLPGIALHRHCDADSLVAITARRPPSRAAPARRDMDEAESSGGGARFFAGGPRQLRPTETS